MSMKILHEGEYKDAIIVNKFYNVNGVWLKAFDNTLSRTPFSTCTCVNGVSEKTRRNICQRILMDGRVLNMDPLFGGFLDIPYGETELCIGDENACCGPLSWSRWDGNNEATLACENIAVWLMENAVAGGGEVGQGHGYDDTVLTASPIGNLAGSVGGYRYFTKSTYLQWDIQMISEIIGNTNKTWSMFVNVLDIPLLYGNVLHWGKANPVMGISCDTTIATRFPTLWQDQGSWKNPTAGVGVPTTGSLWLAWWCDGEVIHSGWSRTKPTKISDFGNNCKVFTASPNEFMGVYMDYPFTGRLFGSWDCNGYVKSLVLSSMCLINNNE